MNYVSEAIWLNIKVCLFLVRFFYILEQQSQRDSDEIRMKAREDVYEYMDQFREFDEDELQEPEPTVLSDLVRRFLASFGDFGNITWEKAFPQSTKSKSIF